MTATSHETTALDCAEYLLRAAYDKYGIYLSNLKLLKLLYYAQGFMLAKHDRPLFNEKIQAWGHGPVVPSVYDEYKSNRAQDIPVPLRTDFRIIPDDSKEMLDKVLYAYGVYSAWALRNMTHQHRIWSEKNYYQTIDQNDIKSFFREPKQLDELEALCNE